MRLRGNNPSSAYPEHVGILQVCLRVALLSVDEVREFRWVAKEEDRRVVEDPIPVTLFRPEFNREASGVASRTSGPMINHGKLTENRLSYSLGRTTFATDRGETHRSTRFVSHLVE